MDRKKNLVWLSLFLFCACFMLAPQKSMASTSGGDMAGVKVKKKEKMEGSDWFIAKTKKLDKYGVIKMENVASGGWAKVKLAGNDKAKELKYAGKTFTTKMRLLDHKGRKIKKPTQVDLYAKINGKKTFLETVKTDSRGWITVSHAMLNVESYLEVKGRGDKTDKDYAEIPIVRTNVKMKGGKWFVGNEKRLDDNRVLKMRNIVDCKSEFEYVGKYEKLTGADLIDELNKSGHLSDDLSDKFKESDFAGKTFPRPFTLKSQLLDDDGHSITKPTKVKITVYLEDRTLEGYVKTDSNGWLTVKGVPVDIKMKLDVKD